MVFHVCAKLTLGSFWESILEAFGIPWRSKCSQKLSKESLRKDVENRIPPSLEKVFKRPPKWYLKSGNFSPWDPQGVHIYVPSRHACLRGWIWRRKCFLGTHFLCPFPAGNRPNSISGTTMFPSGAREFKLKSNSNSHLISSRRPII